MIVLFFLVMLLTSLASAQTQPQSPRVGVNLVPNPTLNGTTNWLLGSTTYDAGQSHTADGSGSIRIQAGARLDLAPRISITAGKQYIFAAYIRTPAWPPGGVNMVIGENDGNGTNINNPESGVAGNGSPNTWQEIAMPFTASSTGASVTLIISRVGFADSGVSDIWVDDLYFGEQLGYASPPSAKLAFNGTDVQVDSLGNMSVKKSGVFQSFFPLCIYADNRRPNNYQFYSNQGFNCDTWGYYDTIVNAANAISAFNPDGMMSGFGIQQTMNSGGFLWDAGGANIHNLEENMKATGKFDSHLLWYYWDNENVWDQWNNQMVAANQWKAEDTVGGQRTHPFYGLQGSYNATRMYHNPANGQTCCDMSGTYTTEGITGGAGHAGGQSVMWNIEGQTFPVVIEQWNGAHRFAAASDLRRIIYTHLIGGAKGFGFWRDCYPDDCGGLAAPIEQVAWWPDVPNIRRELDAMLPMLRQPHWTNWSVSFNTALSLNVGTRDYNGKGHLLIVNTSASPVTVTFTINGLGYTAQTAQNFFSGGTVANVVNNSFTLTIPALAVNSGTAVLALAGGDPTIPVITSALTASGQGGLAFSYQITASNNPTSYNASPLPTGLVVDTTTGLISGTPTQLGTFNVTLNATNATGTGTATLVLTITGPPRIWLTFEECGGTTLHDETANGNTGDLLTAPTVPTFVPGRLGRCALHFNAQQDTVRLNMAPVTTPLTVAVTLNPDDAIVGTTTSVALIPFINSAGDQMGIFWDHAAPTFRQSWVLARNGAYTSCPYTAALSNGVWYRLLMTHDGSTMRTYINGIADCTVTVPGPVGTSTGAWLAPPGAIIGPYPWRGIIEEVIIDSTVWDQTHITSDYNRTFNPPPEGPLGR
jgi:Putative Ig domain/Concanavalin A-like lectin/glucanases superfamily